MMPAQYSDNGVTSSTKGEVNTESLLKTDCIEIRILMRHSDRRRQASFEGQVQEESFVGHPDYASVDRLQCASDPTLDAGNDYIQNVASRFWIIF
jgi:hypothetical protein